ncbi:hypothetical protein [Flavobacterium eburneipallidum]|uniref:hypothetical protein n=1 Tax=Flavobacterium eburneipallidum TaxID=3003263 RepID=UPI0022ABE3B1|nr:hypothetical protein [Flavobacterium eburneipallidum]
MTIKIRLAFLFLFISFVSKAQISVSNADEINKIKNTTTYIAMKDPNSVIAKEYAAIFQKYWTISKIEFIEYSDIYKYLNSKSSFLTIGGYVTDVNSHTIYSGGRGFGVDYSHTHIYLELWKCSDKFLGKSQDAKDFKEKDKTQISRLELFTDFPTLMMPSNLYKTDYDADGHIRNWGLGLFKNHIQNMVSYLNKGTEKRLFSEIVNANELKKLNKETLYIPDYIFTKFNMFTGDESKKHDTKDILNDYKFKYEIVSSTDLNKKILNDDSVFYYLQYIKSSTDKYVSVINSQTGEIVYSVYTPASYNIKSGDLKDLSKVIAKK